MSSRNGRSTLWSTYTKLVLMHSLSADAAEGSLWIYIAGIFVALFIIV